MLFGSPVAGAGVGIDNIAFISWFQYGGGQELYDQLWTEMGVNVKGFMLQPVGPEALGWFKEPINSMEDFRKYRFPHPARDPRSDLQGISGSPRWPWAAETSSRHWRRAPSTPPSGAARSPTASSDSRRC